MVLEYFFVFLVLVEFVFDFIYYDVNSCFFVEVLRMFGLVEVNFDVLLFDLFNFVCMLVVFFKILVFVVKLLG